jgi:predicted NodU family carbamoyl transferase
VSELIDTYDHEPFIEQAAASVLEQDSRVRSEKRAVIPAVTPMDGSVRPQTVDKRIHPPYWPLIDDFEKHTGVPVLLNIACSGMGALVLGCFLIEK